MSAMISYALDVLRKAYLIDDRSMDAADAELAALTAAANELQAARDVAGVLDGVSLSEWLHEEMSLHDDCHADRVDLRVECDMLRATVAEQTRQIEAARPLIEIVKARTGIDTEYNATVAWLAANAPAPEAGQDRPASAAELASYRHDLGEEVK